MNKTSQQLIDDKECLLLNRIKVDGKWQYQVILLPPPPFEKKVTAAKRIRNRNKLYNTVMDAIDIAVDKVHTRGLCDDFPVVLRSPNQDQIMPLRQLADELKYCRHDYAN